MLVGLVATGIISKSPYISLKIDDYRDDSQSLVQARVEITEIASESESTYGNANDGRITISYHIDTVDERFPNNSDYLHLSSVGLDVPPEHEISYLVGNEQSVMTYTTKGTNVTFTGFNAGTYPITIWDYLLKVSFGISLTIGYGTEYSFIRHKNANYIGVGSVFFVPGLYPTVNNSGAKVSITNVRSGFATISSNGLNYQPYNKSLSGTYLDTQRFSIKGLDSGSSSLYATNVTDPITRVTHHLFLSAGQTDYLCPSLRINYINSETSTLNNGSLSLTFNSNELLSADGVTFSLDNGTNPLVQTTTRGASAVFTDLDSNLIVYRNLVVTDLVKNRVWNLRVNLGYEEGLSYIQYNDDHILYQTGDTIIFKTEQNPDTARTRLIYQNKAYNKGDVIELG